MIEDAEDKGIIKPGFTLIEPTSGNTGIGLAMMSAVKGYHTMICLQEKISQEKNAILKGLDASVIRCRTEAKMTDPDSYLSTAYQKHKEIKDSYILNQVRVVGLILVL
jgi:cysteine synthase